MFVCIVIGKLFVGLFDKEWYLIMDYLLFLGLFILGCMVVVEVFGMVV